MGTLYLLAFPILYIVTLLGVAAMVGIAMLVTIIRLTIEEMMNGSKRIK